MLTHVLLNHARRRARPCDVFLLLAMANHQSAGGQLALRSAWPSSWPVRAASPSHSSRCWLSARMACMTACLGGARARCDTTADGICAPVRTATAVCRVTVCSV